MIQLGLPPQQVPVSDNGTLEPTWRRFFEGLWRRSGAGGNTISTTSMTIAPTSNTNLRITYTGTDGVTRTADVTLS